MLSTSLNVCVQSSRSKTGNNREIVETVYSEHLLGYFSMLLLSSSKTAFYRTGIVWGTIHRKGYLVFHITCKLRNYFELSI